MVKSQQEEIEQLKAQIQSQSSNSSNSSESSSSSFLDALTSLREWYVDIEKRL